MKRLNSWLNANKISLNAGKTEFVIFRSQSHKLDFVPYLKISGNRIYSSQFVKYLGVLLDEHLTWKNHVSSVAKKLQRANGMLAKIRHYVPLNSLLNVYHAIFSSHMRYACQVWGLRDSTVTHRILTLQKSAVRLMTFSEPRSASLPLFANLGILKFFDLVKVLNIHFIHQYLNGNLPFDTLNTFNFQKTSHLYGTRCNTMGLLIEPRVHTQNFGSNSLSRLSTLQWNDFQRNFQNSDLSNFKPNQIKQKATAFYLQNYID